MSKNNKLILLGFLVLGIWGSIGYTVFDYLTDDEETSNQVTQHISKKEKVRLDYTLSFQYPDPFLKKKEVVVREATVTKTKRIIPVVQKELPVSVDLSHLKYLGTLYNTSRKSKTATLSISGKEYFGEEGKEIEGIKIIKIYSDSVRIGVEHKIVTLKMKH